MNRLDNIISDVAYILDALTTLRDIQKSGNCNICSNKKKCTFVPKPGRLTRFNCPFYVNRNSGMEVKEKC